MGYVPAHIDVHAPGLTEPKEVAFVLHGILGSGTNWRSFVRRLVTAHPTWLFVLVDLRNHGDSTGAPPPHTVAACAADLAALAEHRGLEPSLVCGHSFGGKVGLIYARDHAVDLDELWLLDAPIGVIPQGGAHPSVRQIEDVMAAVRSVPLPLPSRDALVQALTDKGLSHALGQWMTTNLRLGVGGYRWRFDLDAITAMLADYYSVDGWSVVASPPPHLAIHAVQGGKSDRLGADDVARLEALSDAGAVHLHTLPDAGHWLHVDDPEGLIALLDAALTRVSRRLH